MRIVERRRDLAALEKWIYNHPYLLRSLSEETRDALEQSGDLVAILIAQLPKLENCSLQVSAFSVESVRASSPRAAGVSCLALRSIDISLHATTRLAQYSLFSLDLRARPIIELSARLETLNLHMCGGAWHRPPFLSLPNLKTLRITYSRRSEEGLEWLLSSGSGLRTFFCEASDPPIDGQCVPMLVAEITPAIQCREISQPLPRNSQVIAPRSSTAGLVPLY